MQMTGKARSEVNAVSGKHTHHCRALTRRNRRQMQPRWCRTRLTRDGDSSLHDGRGNLAEQRLELLSSSLEPGCWLAYTPTMSFWVGVSWTRRGRWRGQSHCAFVAFSGNGGNEFSGRMSVLLQLANPGSSRAQPPISELVKLRVRVDGSHERSRTNVSRSFRATELRAPIFLRVSPTCIRLHKGSQSEGNDDTVGGRRTFTGEPPSTRRNLGPRTPFPMADGRR
jgi:hypothetical protein